jgi:uroporphyrinogen decarboxylase
MNRRERFRKAMKHEEPDRILVDLGKHVGSVHQEAYKKLRDYLGDSSMKNDNKIIDRMAMTVVTDESLLKRFNVDFRWLQPNIQHGAKDISDNEFQDMWGVRFRFVGDHWAVCGSPLLNAGTGDLESYPWPDPLSPEFFTGLEEQAKYLYENTDYIIGADGLKNGLLQTALQMRGYEQFLVDMAMDPDFAEALLDKLLEIIKEMWTQYLKRVGKYVQIVYLTDDYGTQASLLMSPNMFRNYLKERNAQLIAHIKNLADVKVMLHSDGAILPLIDDFIEMGVDIINPVQTSIESLSDTAALKAKYGERICFHGGIDVQQVLNKMTPDEIRKEVRRRIYELGRNGGYIIAPCHNVGFDVPPENLVAMYEAISEFGAYPLKL